MLIVKLSTGMVILGLDDTAVRRLAAHEPLCLDLRWLPDPECVTGVMLLAGNSEAEIKRDVEQILGQPLQPLQSEERYN